MSSLAAASVTVEDLGRIPVFHRLRHARVVVGMDAGGAITPVRGAGAWADIVAGRGAEWEPASILVVRTDGQAEHLFLLVAETLSRW